VIDAAATPLQLSAPSLGALLFQFLNSFGFIILATVGLAIIFGMMGVINLAHGEFILIGVYGTALTYHAGIPLPLAMVAGVVVTTIFGVIVERTVVRHLYDRLLDSMVATWGLALVISQLLLIVFGSSLDSISTPMGSVSYGPFSSSIYRSIFLPIVAVAVLGGLYVLFTRTEFGVKARATIKDPETARAMGVDTDRMYVSTFAIGSALAGLTGALYAPALGVDHPEPREYVPRRGVRRGRRRRAICDRRDAVGVSRPQRVQRHGELLLRDVHRTDAAVARGDRRAAAPAGWNHWLCQRLAATPEG